VGAAAVKGGVAAQIAGRIVSVKVKVGDAVAGGDVLLLLEAMKMENEIKAPGAGTVSAVLVTEGQRVGEGETLVVIE
jgi:biotin carboxyl carrier protein